MTVLAVPKAAQAGAMLSVVVDMQGATKAIML